MRETVDISKRAVIDLLRIKAEFDSVVESLELAGNEKFMDSYQKSREQIKNREFADWDEL